MATYRNTATGEVREISDALIAAWQASGNPKALLWEPYTPPPPPLLPPPPEWIAFYAALNADPVIGAAVEEVLRHLLPPSPAANLRALGGLYVGLGQAASDGDSRVFLQTWQLAAAGGLLSPEVIAGVQALAASFNLPAEFIAGLQPPTEEPPE